MIIPTSGGVFRAVSSVTSVMRRGKEFLRFSYLENIGELREGIDIEEPSLKDLTICVDVPKGSLMGEYAILELRRHAANSLCDYFSYAPFRNLMCLLLASNDRFDTYKSRLRLFIKKTDG